MVKRLPAMWKTRVPSLAWEDPPEKEMQPTPVFLLGKFHGWRSLVGYRPWGHKESDMTERLHFLSFSFFLTVWTFISKVMFLLFNMLSVFSCVSFQIFLCKYTYINICMYVSFFFLSFFFFFYTRGRELPYLKKKQIQTSHCTLKFFPSQYLLIWLITSSNVISISQMHASY